MIVKTYQDVTTTKIVIRVQLVLPDIVITWNRYFNKFLLKNKRKEENDGLKTGRKVDRRKYIKTANVENY